MNIHRNQNALHPLTATGLVLAAVLPATLAGAQKPTATAPHAKATATRAASAMSAHPIFVTIKLKGLECVSCAHQVQQGLMGVAGVKSAEVSVPKQTAVVELATKNPPKNDALTAAVKKSGFGVTAVEKGKTK